MNLKNFSTFPSWIRIRIRNPGCRIVSERLLTVWDEFSWFVADYSQEFFSAGDYSDGLVWFSYYFCLMMEWSGSGRSKNIQIWINNTDFLEVVLAWILIVWGGFWQLGKFSQRRVWFLIVKRGSFMQVGWVTHPLICVGNLCKKIWFEISFFFSGTTASCKRDFKIMT